MSTDNTHFADGDSFVGVNLTNTSTTAEFPVGTIVNGSKSSRWEYVQAISGIAQYNAVCINGSGGAAPSTTAHAASMKKVGFAQVAIASGSYGWVARQGYQLTVMLAASCAAGAQLYTTATAGTLDDAVVTAAAVPGAVCTVAASGGGVTNTTIMAAQPSVIISQAVGA
jgi:hypothetical protein